MFALPFIRRRAKGGAGSIPPGTYATLQDVSDAISQLIGGAPDVTLDTIAEIAARIIQDESSLAAVSAAIANKQDRNAKLTALSALALAADKLIYATGANTLAATDLTAFMRSVLAAQDAAGARAAIGAVGQQEHNTYKDTVATAFANKQDKLEFSTFGSQIIKAEGFNSPAYGIATMFVAFHAAGGALTRVGMGQYGGYLVGLNTPAPGSMHFVGDAGSVPDAIVSKSAGRALLTLDMNINAMSPNRAYLPFFVNAGGNLIAAADIRIGAYGQSIITQEMPNAGIMFSSRGDGQIDQIPTSASGRSILTIAPYASNISRFTVPFIKTDGTLLRAGAGEFGGVMLSLDAVGTGGVPYSTNDYGTSIGIISTTPYGRQHMQVATAQAARTLLKQKASIVANTASNTPVPADTQTELLWPNSILPVEGFDQTDIAVTGGRVTTAQTTSLAGRCILSLVTSGPADFSVVLELRDATGATIGNENGAPGQGTGGGWKTMFVPFRVGFPGHHTVVLPDVPLRAGGNFAQLRVRLYTPPGSATVNVSEYQMKITQQA